MFSGHAYEHYCALWVVNSWKTENLIDQQTVFPSEWILKGFFIQDPPNGDVKKYICSSRWQILLAALWSTLEGGTLRFTYSGRKGLTSIGPYLQLYEKHLSQDKDNCRWWESTLRTVSCPSTFHFEISSNRQQLCLCLLLNPQ